MASDPGYGRYIASAAEQERGRRHQTQESSLDREVQKYGIDTSAGTAANQLEFEYGKWRPQEARASYAQTRLEGKDLAQDKAVSTWLQNIDEQDRTIQQYDDVSQFLKDDRPSFGKMITHQTGEDTFAKGYNKWTTGLDDRIWDAIAPISKEDISGKWKAKDVTANILKGLDPDTLIKLLMQQSKIDPGSGPQRQTFENLFDLAK